MFLVKPSFNVITDIQPETMLRKIEKAGRLCYKSEEKIDKDSYKSFIKGIIKRGHLSVIEHENISVLFVTDRGISHELVRHRLASFSEQSTRYCNFAKKKFGNQLTFVIPPWIDITPGNYTHSTPIDLESKGANIWFKSLLHSELQYMDLIINQKWTAEKARSVLPNSLKTEIMVTCNIREWRHVFQMRTDKAAHPQIREIMKPLLQHLQTKLPVLFDDIN